MAKNQNDFQKELESAKKQVVKFSKEAAEIAKKGEKEFAKFTRISKLHLDSTAINLKKEHLYYLIGKEYVRAKAPAEVTPKLKELMVEFNQIDKQQRALRIKMKAAK